MWWCCKSQQFLSWYFASVFSHCLPLSCVAKCHKFSGFSWPCAGICHCWQHYPVLLVSWVFFLIKYWTKGWICSLKAGELGDSYERCHLHKTLITSCNSMPCLRLFSLGWMVNLKFVLVNVYLESGDVDIYLQREADLWADPWPCRALSWSWTSPKAQTSQSRAAQSSGACTARGCSAGAWPRCCSDNIFATNHLLLRKLPLWYLQENDNLSFFHLLIGMLCCWTAQSWNFNGQILSVRKKQCFEMKR